MAALRDRQCPLPLRPCLVRLLSAERPQERVRGRAPAKVVGDEDNRNTKKNSDRQDARIEHDGAPRRVMMELVVDRTELVEPFSDNPGFKKWLSDTIFQDTYTEPAGPSP